MTTLITAFLSSLPPLGLLCLVVLRRRIHHQSGFFSSPSSLRRLKSFTLFCSHLLHFPHEKEKKKTEANKTFEEVEGEKKPRKVKTCVDDEEQQVCQDSEELKKNLFTNLFCPKVAKVALIVAEGKDNGGSLKKVCMQILSLVPNQKKKSGGERVECRPFFCMGICSFSLPFLK